MDGDIAGIEREAWTGESAAITPSTSWISYTLSNSGLLTGAGLHGTGATVWHDSSTYIAGRGVSTGGIVA